MAAINSEFMLTTNASHIPAEEHQAIIQPADSGKQFYQGSEKIQFNIPTQGGAGQYIDWSQSYFEYSLEFVGVASTKGRLPNGGAHTLIDLIEVSSGGHRCEYTNHYRDWYQAMCDLTHSDDDYRGFNAAAQGLKGAGADRLGAELTVGDKYDIAIPPPSQVLQNGKLFPSHALNTLRLEYTLCPAKEGMVCASGAAAAFTNFKIHNPRLRLMYIQVAPNSHKVITEKSGMKWSSSAWEVETDTISTAVSAHTSKMSSTRNSVKTVISWFKEATQVTGETLANKDKDPLSRIQPKLLGYQYNFNGMLRPSTEVTVGNNGTEMAMEVCRAMHSVGSNKGLITAATYAPATPVSDDLQKTQKSTFIIGVNAETYGKSNKVLSGISTISEAPQLLLKFGTQGTGIQGAGTACRIFNAIHYDVSYAIQNGIITAST